MCVHVAAGQEAVRQRPGRCLRGNLVAEWIHFTLFEIILLTHYKTESVYFLELLNSATKVSVSCFVCQGSGLWV